MPPRKSWRWNCWSWKSPICTTDWRKPTQSITRPGQCSLLYSWCIFSLSMSFSLCVSISMCFYLYVSFSLCVSISMHISLSMRLSLALSLLFFSLSLTVFLHLSHSPSETIKAIHVASAIEETEIESIVEGLHRTLSILFCRFVASRIIDIYF